MLAARRSTVMTGGVLGLVLLLLVLFVVGMGLYSPAPALAAPPAAEARWIPLVTTGLEAPLMDLQFVDRSTAVGVADGHLFWSNDGGLRWAREDGPYLWGPLFFLDSAAGWVMGAGSEEGTQYCWRTTPALQMSPSTVGGWLPSPTDLSDRSFATDLQFVDEEHGWLVGAGIKGIGPYIQRTTDGGVTWLDASPPGDFLSGLHGLDFIDPLVGWVVGGWGSTGGRGNTILKTDDGGLTWAEQYGGEVFWDEPISDDTRYPTLLAVDFVDGTHGWAVGQQGLILVTSDGGGHWSAQRSAQADAAALRDVQFLSREEGWAVGDEDTILHTTDGGATWAEGTAGISADLRSVQFLDSSYGWILASDGRILRYSPAGSIVFGDVPEDREDIMVLAREGIIQGYDDGTFRPYNPVLRAQLAKMLVGALGLTVTNGAMPCTFTDVPLGPSSDPLYPDDFVAVAAAKGIVNGFDARTFGPYRPVTRIQMVSMVVRALERLRPGRLEQPPFAWAYNRAEATDPTHGKNVRMAEYNGLLSSWGSFDDSPAVDLYQPATRGEMATMLWTALGGEMAPLRVVQKSSMTLSELRAQLLTAVDSDVPLYLPSQLPPGWAIAQDPYLGVWSGAVENPHLWIDAEGRVRGYQLFLTDGASLVDMTWPFSDDWSSGFTGFQDDGIAFDLGYLYCQPSVDPSGRLMLSSKPWERATVLAVAAVTEQVR